jgi:hypothetical protein
MGSLKTLVLSLLLTFVNAFADSGGDKQQTPKPLWPEIVKAWTGVGAQVGWVQQQPLTPYVTMYVAKPAAGTIPEFLFPRLQEGVGAKLPDPGTPFQLSVIGATNASLKEISSMKNLQSLILIADPQIGDTGLDHLCSLDNLRSLNLMNTAVSDAGLKRLARLKTLESLNLARTRISELKGIAEIKGLKFLGLGETRVSDSSLKELVGLANLKSLDLCGTTVSDACLKELEAFSHLELLDIRDTAITAKGVDMLKKALPKCYIRHP